MDSTSTQTIGISYGAMSDTISDQLIKQGLSFNKETIENFEKCRDGLLRCRFAGIIIDSQYDKILPKLHKKIMQHVAKSNNKKLNK